MDIPRDQAVYRLRKYHRTGDLPPKYECSFEILDEGTQEVLAVCDLAGHALFSTLAITDHQQRTWHMKPNRKIMPSRWIVTDPGERIAIQFDRKLLEKMVKPLHRTSLALLDGEDRELFRVVDTRTSLTDRVLGVDLDDWAVMAGDAPVAGLVQLPRPKEPATGLFGKLKNWLVGSDQGLMSTGARHVLPAPVALGMLLILDSFAKSSGQ